MAYEPPKNYDYSDKYNNKERIMRECISIHEDMKKRRLIHKIWPTTDEIFYSEYIYRLLKTVEMILIVCRRRGTKVLDVGCGEGRLVLLLKSLGLDVTGVDLHAFEGVNTFNEPRGPLLSRCFSENGVEVKTVDIERDNLPFPDNYFDMVMFMDVIEHLHNSPKPILREIARVLNDGAFLLMSTPNHASLRKRINAMRGKSNHWPLKGYYNFEFISPPSLDYVGHVREFTLSEIEMMLKWEDFRSSYLKHMHFRMRKVSL